MSAPSNRNGLTGNREPAGCLDASGVPDYNAVVEVFPADRTPERRVAAAVPA